MADRNREGATTAILITIEGHETAFNRFYCHFITGNPLKLTLDYYQNSSGTGSEGMADRNREGERRGSSLETARVLLLPFS
jgi:hypothetical protein